MTGSITGPARGTPVVLGPPGPEPTGLGRYGEFGGRFIPESLIPACLDLEVQFKTLWADPDFHVEYETLLREYPTRQVRVRVRKLAAPLGGVPGTPSVELVRAR